MSTRRSISVTNAYKRLLWGSMDLLGIRDSVEEKFMAAVVLQYVSAMTLLAIPPLFLGPARAIELFPTSQIALTVVIAVLATVAFFNTVLVVRADILRPIVEMRDVADAIANGRFDTPPSDPDQKDEIGDLKRAFVEMYDYLTTVAGQAHAIRREEFEAPVLGEEVPGEFGIVLGHMQTALRRRIREMRTFKAAIEQAGLAIYITDEEGAIEYVNPAFEEQSGYDREEVIGRSPAVLAADDEAGDRFAQYWTAGLDGEVWESEMIHERRDGSTYHVDRTVAPIVDDSAVAGFVGIGRDVTEIKQYQQELTFFEQAVEHVGTGIAAYDEDGIIRYANDAYAEMLGTSPDTLEGDLVSIVNPEFEPDEFRGYWDSFEERETKRAETVLRRLDDGTEFPVAITTTHIRVNEEAYHVGTVEDITEHRERERRLRQLHRATRRLVTADDREDVADLTARAAQEILGYDSSVVRFVADDRTLRPVAITERAQAEMGPRPDYSLDNANPAARAYEREEPLLLDDVNDFEDKHDRGDTRSAMYLPIGEYGVLSITDSAVGAFDRSDVNLASVLASNTETALSRLDHEREIKRQNERLEEFGRTVAHDLRNPVQTIEGYLDVAKLAEDPAEAHGEIQKAVERMSELIDELLELAKQGKTVIDPSPASLEETAVAAWGQVKTASATLEVDDEQEFLMDQSRVQQLLENLFRNAREHAGSDSTIRVGTLGDGFYVEDDGPGIPEPNRDDVFESGYTTDDDGTGFGLAIVEQIVDAHNWTVSVEEGTEGGARFEFRNVEVA